MVTRMVTLIHVSQRCVVQSRGSICRMLHNPGDLLDRPSIGINTGSNPQRDTIELAEFKYAISLRAEMIGGTVLADRQVVVAVSVSRIQQTAHQHAPVNLPAA